MENLRTMSSKGVIVLVVLAVFHVTSNAASPQNLAEVFEFAENLQSAYELAKHQSKPIMLITHSTYCSACSNLRPKLIGSNEVKYLSTNFIMVNNLNKRDSLADSIKPDGLDYSPRIIFFGCDGSVLDDIFNLNQPKYKYYYKSEKEVVDAMKKAIGIKAPIDKSEI